MKQKYRRCQLAWIVWLLFLIVLPHDGFAEADHCLPADTTDALHYLLDVGEQVDVKYFDAQRIAPLLVFLDAPKPEGTLYHADKSFGSPSAFHQFEVRDGLQQIIDYTLNSNIPSIFFWPSSLRMAKWTHVEGGENQFEHFKTAFEDLREPVVLKGTEHLSITPDQHTGAYYSYDVDKTVILAPWNDGRIMINIYHQQRPSVVGKKGWVLGSDENWSYLYTKDKGLNVKGLKWVKTYMYNSSGFTIYWERNKNDAKVVCGAISWLNAGWAGINMVQPHHIKNGLERMAHAFCAVLEDPRLPDPDSLAATFSKSRKLSTGTLKAYGRDYFNALEQRITESNDLNKKVGKAFDPNAFLEDMTYDELYATLALDYLKKLLDRDPVIEAHPF